MRLSALPSSATAPVPHTAMTIASGDQGTKQTLEVMAQLAVEASRDATFIDHARAIVADLKPKDYRAQAKRIFEHVKETVRYVYDPLGLEVVTDPRWLLFVIGSGDCDDSATLVASLGMALGMGGAFRTVATDCERTPSGDLDCPWSHVYALIGVPRGDSVEWLAADTTQRESFLGWEPEQRVKRVGTWVIAPPA